MFGPPPLIRMHKQPFFSPLFSVEFTTANANVGVEGWRKPNVGVIIQDKCWRYHGPREYYFLAERRGY